MYILADRDFITLRDLSNAKDHNGHLFSYLRTIADTAGASNNFAREPGQAHQHQVGTIALSALNRVAFISGYGHAITVCLQQLFNAVAGLRDILYYEDRQACVKFSIDQRFLVIKAFLFASKWAHNPEYTTGTVSLPCDNTHIRNRYWFALPLTSTDHANPYAAWRTD
jgi:hypothetical protein